MADHLVCDLSGRALDYAVGLALGWERGCAGDFNSGRWMIDGRPGMLITVWSPSRLWEQAGPIIDREQISVESKGENAWIPWEARIGFPLLSRQFGATPLIAAMRAFVASKFGRHVDLPDDLFPLSPEVSPCP